MTSQGGYEMKQFSKVLKQFAAIFYADTIVDSTKSWREQ